MVDDILTDLKKNHHPRDEEFVILVPCPEYFHLMNLVIDNFKWVECQREWIGYKRGNLYFYCDLSVKKAEVYSTKNYKKMSLGDLVLKIDEK